MKQALVTGGCGFVGKHFVKHLLALDYHVTVIDDLSARTRYPPLWTQEKNLAFLQCDCRAYFATAMVCKFDLIIHCAAVVGGRLKIDGDPLAVATDLAIDSDLFNWLAKVPQKPKKVVYFSSSAVYPIELQARDKHVALAENLVHFNGKRIGMPDMTYGWSKMSGEYLAQFAARSYGISVVIYRPFSGYGPGQSFDYPFPSIVKRVMNSYIETATLREKVPVVVWGSGEQLRDFIYIDDVVDAVMETMDVLAHGETLNLGSGIGTSFRQLALRTAAVLDRSVDVVTDASKPEGVFARVADTAKMFKFYRPKISLQEGIRRVYEDLTTGTV